MKFNTHNCTPRRKSGKVSAILSVVSAILIYSIFGLAAFSCFYYSSHILTGIALIILPLFMTAIVLSMVKDIEKAYVEINRNTIRVIDYYFGIKKEKFFSIFDITSKDIVFASSFKVKGYRRNHPGTQYIVFYNNKKYLFKVIYCPETEELLKQCQI